MKFSTIVLSFAVLLATAAAFSFSVNRRNFVGTATASLLIAAPQIATAADESAPDADGFVTTESGLKYKVLKEGTGAIPETGQTVKAHYTGWLDGFDSSKKFDSSRDRGRPFTFRVGAGQVIRGWDESFGTMKVGERRQIILPPRLAYGRYRTIVGGQGTVHWQSTSLLWMTEINDAHTFYCRGFLRRSWCRWYHSRWGNALL